jgi:phospholipid/cholesterol/gamma-HCH transport system substrate-binding protein
METRANHLLVGSFVLVIVAGLAGFVLWLARADLEREVERYEIVFTGSVSGLQQGSQVRYRGIPVGRVTDILIDPQDPEQVLVKVDIRAGTPVKEDTVAELELQGITGIVNVQLTGGTRDSPDLARTSDVLLPRIASRPSLLEQVVEFTPELILRSVTLLERALDTLSEENVQALGSTLAHLDSFTSVLAARGDSFETLIDDTAGTMTSVRAVADDLTLLIADLRGVTATLDARLGTAGVELEASLEAIGTAAARLAAAGGRLDGLLAETREPWRDFTQGGLYEFTQLMGETRLLIASLGRISKEFERDPTGFLIGGQRGFRAE